ncbi:hypothetical protein ACVWZR_001850 [Bradyrhizobium sp. i1.3.1]
MQPGKRYDGATQDYDAYAKLLNRTRDWSGERSDMVSSCASPMPGVFLR